MHRINHFYFYVILLGYDVFLQNSKGFPNGVIYNVNGYLHTVITLFQQTCDCVWAKIYLYLPCIGDSSSLCVLWVYECKYACTFHIHMQYRSHIYLFRSYSRYMAEIQRQHVWLRSILITVKYQYNLHKIPVMYKSKCLFYGWNYCEIFCIVIKVSNLYHKFDLLSQFELFQTSFHP